MPGAHLAHSKDSVNYGRKAVLAGRDLRTLGPCQVSGRPGFRGLSRLDPCLVHLCACPVPPISAMPSPRDFVFPARHVPADSHLLIFSHALSSSSNAFPFPAQAPLVLWAQVRSGSSPELPVTTSEWQTPALSASQAPRRDQAGRAGSHISPSIPAPSCISEVYLLNQCCYSN